MPLLNTSKLAVAALAAVLLTACGGGGGDGVAVSDAGGYTVESGVAQKGPLAQGSAIWVNELAATTYTPNGREYTFRTNNDFGTFTPSGITYGTPYLSTLAQGYYYNEITGTQSDDIVSLGGLSQIGTAGNIAADTAINVNVLSTMAVNRIIKLATTAPTRTFAAARAKAQKETLGAFFIYNDASILSGTKVGGVAQPANLTALDLSKSRAADQILAAVSAVVMKAGVNGAGVNALLSQTASDLEDDGLLNNSTNYRTSVQSKLCAAAVSTDFGKVATNLNIFYGTNYSASDLSRWVDTSGCVDQVIDKYKYSGGSATSPVYTVDSDDVGQCFSALTGTLTKNGVAVKTGTVKAVTGDNFSLTVDSVTAPTGFIQRSTPDSAGTCPATAPATGLVRVLKYSAAVVTTFAGSGLLGSTDGNTTSASFNNPGAVAFDAIGNTYVSDGGNNVVRKIDAAGLVTTLAGNPVQGKGDCSQVPANFNGPSGIAVDSAGYVYVAYRCSHKIAKISPAGVAMILAGSGVAGNADGVGSSASFNNPTGLALDAYGNIYVADYVNSKIRKITPTGFVTTVAGSGVLSDIDGTGLAASFNGPDAIAIDAIGNLYVTEWSGGRVRKVSPVGVVTTIAGNGTSGTLDGLGTAANFQALNGITVDKSGNLYVAETDGNRIRKINPSGLVTKIAGTGAGGSSNGLGLTASFLRPCGMAADAAGNIVVSDCGNNKLRKILLNSVGSGRGGGTSANTAIGFFKGPSVEGLTAVSGNTTSTTDRDGSFTYEQGKKIIFSVGKILLGSINAGKSIVTPMDLVEGGAVSSSTVSNMVRFLIMLDDDGNPSNGVRISSTTQLIAANSAQVDFSHNSSTFVSNVNSIISQINAADGGSHSLLTTDAAISYLTNTVRCAWSGAYEGPYSGASVSGAVTDRGKAYFIIHPVTGIGTGGYVGTTNIGDNYSGALQGTQSMGLNNQGAIVIGTGGAGTAFNGRFNTADNISGTWSSVRNPDDPKNGIFTGSRVGGLPSAKYRFTGASSDNMIIVFDISGGASNIVSGVLLNPATGISENINGTLSGTLLSAQSTTGVSLTATVNLSDGTVSNGRRGATSFNATGCSLI